MNTVRFIPWMVVFAVLASDPKPIRGAEPRGEVRDFMVRVWGKADGLPDASVTAILQASDAYLWVGTSAGLVRFDGVKFTPAGLRSPSVDGQVSIAALGEDRAGHLWVGSQAGLFCLAEGKIAHYGRAEGLLDDGVTSLAIDAAGGVWIGTRRGVNRWDGQRFTGWTARDGLPDDWVSGIHAARSGSVWVTTRGGMCSYTNGRMAPFEFQTVSQGRNAEFLGVYEDLRRNLWAFGATYLINLTEGKRFNYFHGEEPASMRIWSLCEGRDGQVWIGTSGRGLFWFDGNKFQPATFGEGSGPTDVRAICEDREGNLWLGISGGGLARLRPQSFVLFKGAQGAPPRPPTSLALDAFGRVNVGFEWGGLLVNQGQRLERIIDRTGVVGQDTVSGLATGSDGSLWVASQGAGLCRVKDGRVLQLTTADGLSDNCVLAVCASGDGSLWVGTRAGVLHRLGGDGTLAKVNAPEGLPSSPITALLTAREGGVWVGTASGTLLRGGPGSLQRMSLPQPLVGKAVLSLYEDAGGRLWVGSAGGLACLASRRSWNWNAQDGLPDETILGIVEDGGHNLWVITGKGVCRIGRDSVAQALADQGTPQAQLVFETATGRDRSMRPGGNRALRSPDGRLWFATTDGLLALDTQGWGVEQPPPPVYLETVLVNGQPLPMPPRKSRPGKEPSPALRLPANLRSLEMQFTALNFTAPERVQFRHKLEGFDTDWADSGRERRVRYGRLPSGPYEFKVTACNGDGIWNAAGAELAFVVPTPLWRAPWVLGLYGLTATGGVVGLVRLVSHRRLRRRLARLEQQQAMERERVRIAQDMHDEIGSKLTKISFMSERAKVELKETGPVAGQIDAIARTSREVLKALDEIVWAVNPRNDSVENLAVYLAQYAAEYFHNTPVECELHLQRELPHQVMSAEIRHNLFLAFEEALNNVLKHSGAAHVRIEIGVHQGRLQLRIHDDGRGFNSEPTTGRPSADAKPPGAGGNGLINMRDRLTGIGGQCEVVSQPAAGATVNLSIPITLSNHSA